MWSRLGVLSLALGAAALAAGCADRTAGPTLDAGPAFSRGGESWWGQGHRQGRWRSSSARYSDHGHKPATGRSGSATLTVRALLGRDGTTDVDVTTGELDSPSPAPGTLAKVQVKGFGVDRHLLFVRNYDHLTGFGSASFSLAGLMRGSTVQVQALVRGIDWKRTDVVTVREEVKRRPDLQVADLTVPPQAPADAPVNIMATISEINGDVGARGSCVLYVDGAEADRADGIWVDAGDVVSCLFTHSFAVGGTHALVVGVEDVVPADDNPDNNSVSGSIEIVSGKPLSSYAYARDEQVDQTFTQYYSFAKADDSEGSESQDQFTDFHQVSQQSYISAWTEDLLSFPLTRVEISASKGGTTVFSMALEDLPADWTDAGPTYVQSCATRWDPSGYMELCTYQSGATTQSWVYGSQSAGVVTYFATGYSHSWNLATGEDTYYDYTDNCPGCSASGTVAPFGADVAWTVDLNDGGSRYHASPTIIMGGPRDDSWNDPWSCAEYLFGDWVYKTCGESQGSSRTAEGVASEP